MKICVLSDTHIPASADKIPEKILETAKSCSLIIHCGDLTEREVLRKLERIAETKVVYGNMDGPELKSKLPQEVIFKAGAKTIGVTHGSGGPAGLLERVKEVFRNEKVDIVIFGHSHTPFNETVDGVLYFNPGSACDTVFAPFRSFGVIEIEDDKVKAEIITLSD